MVNNIKLNKKQIDYLSSLPEQGMGYQIVDIFFINGTVLKKRIVLNSSLLKLEENENIDPNEINTIQLHSE
jgi:hypothetical protein